MSRLKLTRDSLYENSFKSSLELLCYNIFIGFRCFYQRNLNWAHVETEVLIKQGEVLPESFVVPVGDPSYKWAHYMETRLIRKIKLVIFNFSLDYKNEISKIKICLFLFLRKELYLVSLYMCLLQTLKFY